VPQGARSVSPDGIREPWQPSYNPWPLRRKESVWLHESTKEPYQ